MPLPLAQLIAERMAALGLDRQQLGFRLGYTNPAKAAGRVQALCAGVLHNERSKRALLRLPAALEVPPEVVEAAVAATQAVLDEDERIRAEERRRQHEAYEAAYRARFRPHAVLRTEFTRPTSISLCAWCGGPEAFLVVPVDSTQPPETFVHQALDAIDRGAIRRNRNGVIFFGELLGV